MINKGDKFQNIFKLIKKCSIPWLEQWHRRAQGAQYANDDHVVLFNLRLAIERVVDPGQETARDEHGNAGIVEATAEEARLGRVTAQCVEEGWKTE